MAVRIPFFGLLSMRSPLLGILEHYEEIEKAMKLIEDSMSCYISQPEGGVCQEFSTLQNEVNKAEDHADTIKRNMRNHMPLSIFMPVDKHIFFNYTRRQDNILDAGQAGMQWLSMRQVHMPENFEREFIFFIGEVSRCVSMLRPAIEGTIAWVTDESLERDQLKQLYRSVRKQHKQVTAAMNGLNSKLYSSDLDFKDIYQLLKVIEQLHNMSHNAEGCADLLRIMIAK